MDGCYENDDFAPYAHYTIELDEVFSDVEVGSLSAVIPNADEIARKYADRLTLTMIELITEDAGLTGDIQFIYAKAHETRNQITIVKIFFDFESKCFYSLQFTQGHGKRVSAILEQISDKYINMPFEELFKLDETKYEGLNKPIIINYIRDCIIVSYS